MAIPPNSDEKETKLFAKNQIENIPNEKNQIMMNKQKRNLITQLSIVYSQNLCLE